MAGVRIQHPTERSCTFTLVDASRPYRPPIECGVCHRTHLFKTYHLVLDASGAVIVSPEIAERLKSFPLNGGFQIVGEVSAPPPQTVRVGFAPQVPGVVAHPTLTEPV